MNISRMLVSGLLEKIAPIKNTRIVFMSFYGHYSDSPKYICNAIHKLNPSVELIWLTDKTYAKEIPSWANWVDIRSFRAHWMMGSAKALVDNVYCGRCYELYKNDLLPSIKKTMMFIAKNKRHQSAFSTWHGVPLKKMGRDQIGNDVQGVLCAPITMIFNNEYTAEIMKNITFNKARVLCLGTPRNDILFHPELKDSTKKKLELPSDKKIVLFAPTFRNDGRDVENKNIHRSGLDQLEQIDFQKLFEVLSKKFGGDWVMVCRFHYAVSDMVNWTSLNKQYPGKFINGNCCDDMAEYLLCSDALVTDASSCMFDFAITRKPVFLFFPDLDNYEKHERGFYLPIDKLPFSISKTSAGLLENIKTFDQERYEENISSMFDRMVDYDDGNASERIADLILRECGLKKTN